MSTEILMPALSPTMTEGKLAKWLKNQGDAVMAGDVIAEIETDKATMEVEAVDEGRLAQILVPAGTEAGAGCRGTHRDGRHHLHDRARGAARCDGRGDAARPDRLPDG